MTLRPLCLIALLALGACELGNNPPEAPAAEETAAPPAPKVGPEGPFQVANDGVAGLTAASRLYIPAVQTAFPGATVKETYSGEGSDLTAVLTVTGENDLSLDVLPGPRGSIGAVVAYGGPVVGPGGGKIGGKLADTGLTPAQCKPGGGQFSGRQICSPADAPKTAYVVAGGVIRQIYWSSGGETVTPSTPRALEMQVKR